MGRKGFLPSTAVEHYLQFARPDLREIALELRNLVASVCPSATERILWGGLSYHDAIKGGPVKGAICQIAVERDCVKLAFIHGARLNDPDALLEGERLSKRYITVDEYEGAPWHSLRDLIAEAAALETASFGPLR